MYGMFSAFLSLHLLRFKHGQCQSLSTSLGSQGALYVVPEVNSKDESISLHNISYAVVKKPSIARPDCASEGIRSTPLRCPSVDRDTHCISQDPSGISVGIEVVKSFDEPMDEAISSIPFAGFFVREHQPRRGIRAFEKPSPVQPGTTDHCKAYYQVKWRDTCYEIAAAAQIPLREFYALNAGLTKGCTNLWAYYYVCVSASLPSLTSPGPSFTPMAVSSFSSGITRTLSDLLVHTIGASSIQMEIFEQSPCGFKNGVAYTLAHTGQVFLLECEISYDGEIIGGTPRWYKTFEQCIAACAYTAECMLAEYYPAQGRPMCYLKKTTGNRRRIWAIHNARLMNDPPLTFSRTPLPLLMKESVTSSPSKNLATRVSEVIPHSYSLTIAASSPLTISTKSPFSFVLSSQREIIDNQYAGQTSSNLIALATLVRLVSTDAEHSSSLYPNSPLPWSHIDDEDSSLVRSTTTSTSSEFKISPQPQGIDISSKILLALDTTYVEVVSSHSPIKSVNSFDERSILHSSPNGMPTLQNTLSLSALSIQVSESFHLQLTSFFEIRISGNTVSTEEDTIQATNSRTEKHFASSRSTPWQDISTPTEVSWEQILSNSVELFQEVTPKAAITVINSSTTDLSRGVDYLDTASRISYINSREYNSRISQSSVDIDLKLSAVSGIIVLTTSTLNPVQTSIMTSVLQPFPVSSVDIGTLLSTDIRHIYSRTKNTRVLQEYTGLTWTTVTAASDSGHFTVVSKQSSADFVQLDSSEATSGAYSTVASVSFSSYAREYGSMKSDQITLLVSSEQGSDYIDTVTVMKITPFSIFASQGDITKSAESFEPIHSVISPSSPQVSASSTLKIRDSSRYIDHSPTISFTEAELSHHMLTSISFDALGSRDAGFEPTMQFLLSDSIVFSSESSLPSTMIDASPLGHHTTDLSLGFAIQTTEHSELLSTNPYTISGTTVATDFWSLSASEWPATSPNILQGLATSESLLISSNFPLTSFSDYSSGISVATLNVFITMTTIYFQSESAEPAFSSGISRTLSDIEIMQSSKRSAEMGNVDSTRYSSDSLAHFSLQAISVTDAPSQTLEVTRAGVSNILNPQALESEVPALNSVSSFEYLPSIVTSFAIVTNLISNEDTISEDNSYIGSLTSSAEFHTKRSNSTDYASPSQELSSPSNTETSPTVLSFSNASSSDIYWLSGSSIDIKMMMNSVPEYSNTLSTMTSLPLSILQSPQLGSGITSVYGQSVLSGIDYISNLVELSIQSTNTSSLDYESKTFPGPGFTVSRQTSVTRELDGLVRSNLTEQSKHSTFSPIYMVPSSIHWTSSGTTEAQYDSLPILLTSRFYENYVISTQSVETVIPNQLESSETIFAIVGESSSTKSLGHSAGFEINSSTATFIFDELKSVSTTFYHLHSSDDTHSSAFDISNSSASLSTSDLSLSLVSSFPWTTITASDWTVSTDIVTPFESFSTQPDSATISQVTDQDSPLPSELLLDSIASLDQVSSYWVARKTTGLGSESVVGSANTLTKSSLSLLPTRNITLTIITTTSLSLDWDMFTKMSYTHTDLDTLPHLSQSYIRSENRMNSSEFQDFTSFHESSLENHRSSFRSEPENDSQHGISLSYMNLLNTTEMATVITTIPDLSKIESSNTDLEHNLSEKPSDSRFGIPFSTEDTVQYISSISSHYHLSATYQGEQSTPMYELSYLHRTEYTSTLPTAAAISPIPSDDNTLQSDRATVSTDHPGLLSLSQSRIPSYVISLNVTEMEGIDFSSNSKLLTDVSSLAGHVSDKSVAIPTSTSISVRPGESVSVPTDTNENYVTDWISSAEEALHILILSMRMDMYRAPWKLWTVPMVLIL